MTAMDDERYKQSIFSIPMTRAEALRGMVAGAAAGALGLAACRGGGSREGGEDRVPVQPVAGEGRVTLRRNGRNGDEVSLLGFGCMRFPTVGGDRYTGRIDEQPTLEMLDYAYSHGVNYFDTAWMYHNGTSETVLGKALKRYPRESFFLADKMPPTAKTLSEAKEIFATQLERCGVEYFDYYLCHSISRQYVFQGLYLDEGVLDWLVEQKRAGRIRNLGFSFHGDMPLFRWLLSQPVEWDFVQIQMNWLDWRDKRLQAETMYDMLAERDLPVVVMEPIRGGALIELPSAVRGMLAAEDPDLTPAAWALKFCASYPHVLTVLSGMSRLEHVVENCATLTDFTPLSDERLALLQRAADRYRGNSRVDCTDCFYCMPCPYGVDIAGIFRVYNRCVDEGRLPDPDGEHDEEYMRRRRMLLNRYKNTVAERGRADHCIGCEQCSPKCPQNIRIPQQLEMVERLIERVW